VETHIAQGKKGGSRGKRHSGPFGLAASGLLVSVGTEASSRPDADFFREWVGRSGPDPLCFLHDPRGSDAAGRVVVSLVPWAAFF
jgi:hypothetical protein